MIYQVDHQKKAVTINEMNDQHMYIAMLSLEEFVACHQQFHVSKRTLERCQETSALNQNVMIPYNQYYYGMINLINARDIFVKRDAFAFFIFKNLFLVIILDDEDQHIERVFQSSSDYVLERGVSITRLVYYFLSELIGKDNQYIEELQEEIEELENHDQDETSLSFTNRLRQLSKELLLLRNYYENLVAIGEELEMNHHHIFAEDDMRYFEIFTRRIERLSENVQMLRELLMQANEAHQAKLDYKLNKTMQLFTVITTIFFPLTLIAGWYGMNFENMPELQSPYGYYAIISISILLVIGLVYWFKKKHFL